MKLKVIAIVIGGLLFFEWNCEGVTYFNPFSSWVTQETGGGLVGSDLQCEHRLRDIDVSLVFRELYCMTGGNCYEMIHYADGTRVVERTH